MTHIISGVRLPRDGALALQLITAHSKIAEVAFALRIGRAIDPAWCKIEAICLK